MRWSYRIGRIAGTDIKVHVTFMLLVGWWAVMGYQEGGPSGALTGALSLLALFACILLHEFGHILMARRFGVRTPDVILLPIGGVARLERIPDEPRQELLIALAGPAVTLAIIVAALPHPPAQWCFSRRSVSCTPETPFLAQLMAVNIYLLLFNLIPAFPMDGGRVLRAILSSRLGSGPGHPSSGDDWGRCSRWSADCTGSPGPRRSWSWSPSSCFSAPTPRPPRSRRASPARD